MQTGGAVRSGIRNEQAYLIRVQRTPAHTPHDMTHRHFLCLGDEAKKNKQTSSGSVTFGGRLPGDVQVANDQQKDGERAAVLKTKATASRR